MDRIFTDSGAFLAWYSDRDAYHQRAARTYSTLLASRTPLVTTNLVLNEIYTWLERRAPRGHQSAVEFGTFVRGVSTPVYPHDPPQGGLAVVYSTPEIERRAWDIFTRYDTAGFSFTDCVSFAVMEALGIRKVFTYDEHFEVMGFEKVG